MMYRYGYPPVFGSGFGFDWIVMLIFWVLIIWAIIAIVRAISGRGEYYHHEHHMHDFREDQAMKTLRERYAKGEIDKEEYEQRKKDLEMK